MQSLRCPGRRAKLLGASSPNSYKHSRLRPEKPQWAGKEFMQGMSSSLKESFSLLGFFTGYSSKCLGPTALLWAGLGFRSVTVQFINSFKNAAHTLLSVFTCVLQVSGILNIIRTFIILMLEPEIVVFFKVVVKFNLWYYVNLMLSCMNAWRCAVRGAKYFVNLQREVLGCKVPYSENSWELRTADEQSH